MGEVWLAVFMDKSESIYNDECSSVASECGSGVVPSDEEGVRCCGGGSNGSGGSVSFLNNKIKFS
jgi:hypothetical protein